MKETTIITCISCPQELRIPTDKGDLKVRCPKCKSSWTWENNIHLKQNEYRESNQRTTPDIEELKKSATEAADRAVESIRKRFSEGFYNEKNHKKHHSQEELLKDIEDQIKKIRKYTPKVGVFGNSGVGKSSLCNALFGKDVAKISDVEACTREPQEILLGSKNGDGGIILVDVPGIGEDPQRHEEYTALYKSLAPKLDLILWAIKADDRNYASGLEAYAEITSQKGKDAPPPIIFVVTQIDKTNPIKEWNNTTNTPGETQTKNIKIKEHEIAARFKTPAENIISISSESSYNLRELVSLIVKVLPNQKKYSFTREAKEENVTIEAREIAEKGIWQSIKETFGPIVETVKDAAIEIIVASATKLVSKGISRLKSILF